jgi:uncharacterized protein with von Willebrand factor type A (vWA) domain
MRYRYSKWDDTQQIFPIDEEDVMNGLSEHLLFPGDLERALRSMAWQGLSTSRGGRLMGLQELLSRLTRRRSELLRHYNLSSSLSGIARRLDDIIKKEKRGIHRRLKEARERLKPEAARQYGLTREAAEEIAQMMEQKAARSLEFIRNLPPDVGGRLEALSTHEFMDPEAQNEFDELLEELKKSVMGNIFQDLSQKIQRLTRDDIRRIKDMLRDLNLMIRSKLSGREPDFQEFLKRHASTLGPTPPQSLEEFLSRMAMRVAQMHSLLSSMPEEMRESLRKTIDAALGDEELRGELQALAEAIEKLVPMDELRGSYEFSGQEDVSLAEALRLMDRLQGIDEMEAQLRRMHRGGSLEEVDEERLEELLGPEARQHLHELKRLSEILQEAGYLRQEGTQMELTPKGIRRLGHKALREIFSHLKRDRMGGHPIPHPGTAEDFSEGTKPFEYGDPFVVDLKETLFNTIRRTGGEIPLRFEPADFQVHRTEQRTECSTVLMLDLSLSMAMRGSFFAAKKMAMALETLMRTQFPRDRLYIVGFSTYAREIKPEQLPYLGWDEFDPYTNIQHGLMVAQSLLSRTRTVNKQILMVSDGEPTAHMEGGRLYIQYPPAYRTLEMTLREVQNCTRRGILINMFMLDANPFLMRFVSEMTRINKGRVFYTTPDRLGQYVLVDYLTQRRRHIH